MSDIYEVLARSRPFFLSVRAGEFGATMFSTSSNAVGQVVTGAMDPRPVLQSDSTGQKCVPFGVTLRRLEGAHGVNVVALPDAPLFIVGTSEPEISGTSIPLYRISALLDGGMSIAEVLEDFPSLTAQQIVMARDYARQHPNFGKPYPKKSLKRLVGNSGLAELEQTLRWRKKRS
jgi:uncharacterized protein (DUF433 family)